MKREVVIYGAGGLGREVLSMLTDHPTLKARGFLDDGKLRGTQISGLTVLSEDEVVYNKLAVVIAIGDPLVKKNITEKLRSRNVEFVSVIHPSVIIQSASVKIGAGSIIGAGAILTTDITIGENVLVNLGVTVGHDVSIGKYTSIMPGVNIAGEVFIGDSVLIGAGVNVINRVRIGNESRVGMGAVVLRDVESGTTVVGVPAKPTIK